MKTNKWMRGLAIALGVLLAGVVAAPIALSSQDIIAWAGSPSGLGLGDPWDTYTFVALDMAAAMCVGMVVYAAWRGETAGAFGLLVWVFAFGSAYANYRHGTREGAPGDAWWFFPAMSLAGPALLEVTVRRIRRWVQTTAGRYERPLPHFRLVRWLPGIAMRETWRAWKLAVTEGYSRPEDAITAARMVRTRTHIRPEPALRSEASDVHRPGPGPDHPGPIEGAASAGVLPVHSGDGGMAGRDVSGRTLHPSTVGREPRRGAGLAAAGAGGPGGGTVTGAGSDELASGRDRAKSIDAVVMRILDARGRSAHDVKRGDIIDDVTRELGPVTIGSVGNALGRLRAIENASSNGGMRVR